MGSKHSKRILVEVQSKNDMGIQWSIAQGPWYLIRVSLLCEPAILVPDGLHGQSLRKPSPQLKEKIGVLVRQELKNKKGQWFQDVFSEVVGDGIPPDLKVTFNKTTWLFDLLFTAHNYKIYGFDHLTWYSAAVFELPDIDIEEGKLSSITKLQSIKAVLASGGSYVKQISMRF